MTRSEQIPLGCWPFWKRFSKSAWKSFLKLVGGGFGNHLGAPSEKTVTSHFSAAGSSNERLNRGPQKSDYFSAFLSQLKIVWISDRSSMKDNFSNQLKFSQRHIGIPLSVQLGSPTLPRIVFSAAKLVIRPVESKLFYWNLSNDAYVIIMVRCCSVLLRQSTFVFAWQQIPLWYNFPRIYWNEFWRGSAPTFCKSTFLRRLCCSFSNNKNRWYLEQLTSWHSVLELCTGRSFSAKAHCGSLGHLPVFKCVVRENKNLSWIKEWLRRVNQSTGNKIRRILWSFHDFSKSGSLMSQQSWVRPSHLRLQNDRHRRDVIFWRCQVSNIIHSLSLTTVDGRPLRCPKRSLLRTRLVPSTDGLRFATAAYFYRTKARNSKPLQITRSPRN